MSKVSRLKKDIKKVLKKSTWRCPRCGGKKCFSTSCPEYLCLHIICLKCKYHEATHPLAQNKESPPNPQLQVLENILVRPFFSKKEEPNA